MWSLLVTTTYLAWYTLCAGLTKAQSCTSCPNGWVTFDESCYYFGHGQGMSFLDAQHYCKQHNSNLVHVNNAIENAFLKDYMNRLSHSNYWMGLSDELIEGVFTWSDDNTRPEFTDWAPGQPDDSQRSEDCVLFWNGHGFRWDDAPCSSTSPLQICEKPAGGFETVVG